MTIRTIPFIHLIYVTPKLVLTWPWWIMINSQKESLLVVHSIRLKASLCGIPCWPRNALPGRATALNNWADIFVPNGQRQRFMTKSFLTGSHLQKERRTSLHLPFMKQQSANLLEQPAQVAFSTGLFLASLFFWSPCQTGLPWCPKLTGNFDCHLVLFHSICIVLMSSCRHSAWLTWVRIGIEQSQTWQNSQE